MRGSKGGVGWVVRTPLEFEKLNITDITGNEKKSYLLRLDTPWKKNFWIRA